MLNLTDYLLELSDKLDKSGKLTCADAVDSLIKTASLQKIAQYVGAIGYVLKQNRAMMNCIRKKRVASDDPMQKVILDCLHEYQDGQDYNDTEWTSKYAQVIKRLPYAFKTAHIDLVKSIFESNDLSTHIQELQKVSSVLEEHNVKDQVINKVLEHVEALHQVLKEEDQSLPFKVASQESSRPWWRRIFSPSKKHWWAPRSWTLRGDLQDTLTEIKNVRGYITDILSVVRLMKDHIVDTRDNIASLVGTNEDIELKFILETFNKINPNNATATFMALPILRKQIADISMNHPISRHLHQLTNFLQNSKIRLNSYFGDIGRELDNLSNRSIVSGMNRSGVLHELALLQRSLSALKYNIFDPKAEESVNIAFGLFFDRIKDVYNPESTMHKQRIYDWLGESRPYQQLPTEQLSGVNENQIKGIVNKIQSTLKNNPKYNNFETLTTLSSLFRNIGRDLINENPKLHNIFDTIANLLSQTPITPQGISIPTSAATPPASMSTQTSTPTTSTPTPTPTSAQQPTGYAFTEEDKRKRTEEIQALVEQMKAKHPGTMAQNSLINDNKISLIKLADIVDEISSEVADVIDKYIESQGPVAEVIPIPEFGALVEDKFLET